MHPRQRRPQSRVKFAIAICVGLFASLWPAGTTALMAQTTDPTSYLTPDVARVGDRLACRCGGCRNTVGNCPMIRCGSADPKRKRIYEMKKAGYSDDAVVSRIVQEEGAVALSAPPAGSIGGLISWIMPPIALMLGFIIYMRFVGRNRARTAPPELSDRERAAMEKYRSQIEEPLQ